MMGQSHICNDCGDWVGSCDCYMPSNYDGERIKEERKVGMSPELAAPYKPTKILFLEKCFGEYWDKETKTTNDGRKQVALRSWLACAERFNVPASDVPFLVGDIPIVNIPMTGKIEVVEDGFDAFKWGQLQPHIKTMNGWANFIHLVRKAVEEANTNDPYAEAHSIYMNRYRRMKKVLGIQEGSDVEAELVKIETETCFRCGQPTLFENNCHTGFVQRKDTITVEEVNKAFEEFSENDKNDAVYCGPTCFQEGVKWGINRVLNGRLQ